MVPGGGDAESLGPVILHVWRAGVTPSRLDDYRRFERERRLPMLHRQPGFLGALFLRGAGDLVASVTIWEDKGAVEALESSPSYRDTIAELVRSGLLTGEPSEETFEVAHGTLRPEPLISALDVAGPDVGDRPVGSR